MKIVKNKKEYNDYNLMGLTEGKILAMWRVFKNQGTEHLTAVEYDVWIVLDRWVEANMPEYYIAAKAKEAVKA
jgi:hypothetical protein